MAKKRETSTAAKVAAPGEPVYTVMAFITFVGLVVGCILLYLDKEEYSGKPVPDVKIPASITKLGDASPSPAAASTPQTPAPMTPMPGM